MLTCTVVCDVPPRPRRFELTLPAGATLADALLAVRGQCDADAIDWQHLRAGIWGVEQSALQVLQPGDRVEVYRSLPNDPREARRQRVRRQGQGFRPPAR